MRNSRSRSREVWPGNWKDSRSWGGGGGGGGGGIGRVGGIGGVGGKLGGRGRDS